MGGTRDTRLLAVLVGVTLVVAIISSLGAPLVPSLAASLDVPIPSAQWSLTVALLAGPIAAPVLGRLGDGPRRRETMVMVLGLVLVGGVAAWQADSLGVLIAGRAVQGVGLGLAPVAMAAARAHLPAERSSAAIALLSVTGAAGVGAGYPISGLIASRFDVHDAFLFGAFLSGAAAVAVLMVVPSSGSAAGAPLDTPGALALAVGLVATLLGIDQGGAQGWSSTATLGLLLFGAVVIGLWARLQLASRYPLVDLRQLRHRAVAGARGRPLHISVRDHGLRADSRRRLRSVATRRRTLSGPVLGDELGGEPRERSRHPPRRCPAGALHRLVGDQQRRCLLLAGAQPAVARLRHDGVGGHRLRRHVRRHPGGHRPRRPESRDRQRPRLLPGGPFDRVFARERAHRIDPRQPSRSRRARRERIRPGRLSRKRGVLGRRRVVRDRSSTGSHGGGDGGAQAPPPR